MAHLATLSRSAEPTAGSISPRPSPVHPSMLSSTAFASQAPFQTVVLKAPSTSPEMSPPATVVRSNPNVVFATSGHTSPTPVPSPQSGHRRSSPPRSSPRDPLPPMQARKVIRHNTNAPPMEDPAGVVVYGIGMKVDTKFPHLVQQVSNLQDPSGQNINASVTVGDVMIAVDNIEFHQGESASVESAVLGEFGTVARITLKSKDTGLMYTIHARRHFAIRAVSRASSRKASIREMSSYDAQDRVPILMELQGIRNDVLAENSFMLRESTIGIGLGAVGTGNVQRFVQTLILGSPAHLSGAVAQGDEIIMVDGFRTGNDGAVTSQRLHGSSKIGSQCSLTLDRSGNKNSITLLHTSAEALRRTERLLEGIDSILRGIRQGVGNQALENSTQIVWDAAIEVEVSRQQLEVKVVELLRSLQTRVINRVDRVEASLRTDVASEQSMDFSQSGWSGTSSREDGSPWVEKKVVRKEGPGGLTRALPPGLDSHGNEDGGDGQGQADVVALQFQLRGEKAARERLEEELTRRNEFLLGEKQSRMKTESEVERLRADVWKIREETAGMVPRDSLDDLNAVCRQYVSTIEGLRTQINTLTGVESKAEEMGAEVERLQGVLRARDDMVQELQAQLAKSVHDRDATGSRHRENSVQQSPALAASLTVANPPPASPTAAPLTELAAPQNLRAQVAELQRKLQEKDSERIAAESARQLTQKAVEGLADSKRQLSRANMDLRSSTEAEIAKMREELMHKDDAIHELNERLREQEGMKAATTEACQIMRGEADNLTRTNMELLASIKSLNNHVKDREYTIANRDASIEELQRIVDNVQNKAPDPNAGKAQFQRDLQALQAKVAELDKEVREKGGECWALTETNGVLRKDVEDLTKSKQALAHTNMKLIEKVELLEREVKTKSTSPTTASELDALRVAVDNSSKEKERLEQTIVRERTRVKALEHEKERMKSHRDSDLGRWEQRVLDLEAELVRKNAGLEELQLKLNDALESQEKLQASLSISKDETSSPDKTKKLNAVIFNMSEKVEDLKNRLKELEVERDDATEAVRMQEEQILRLQERLAQSSDAAPERSNGDPDAHAARASNLEAQLRDLQARLERTEAQHALQLSRLRAPHAPAPAPAAPREVIALDKARRSFPPAQHDSAQLRSARPEPTVLAASPPRSSPTHLSPSRISPSRLSPVRYQSPPPDASPTRTRVPVVQRQLKPSPSAHKKGVIGIQVESGVPYRVLKVSEMMDEQGRFVKDWVQPADELVKIDGYPVVDAPVFEVFSRLSGNVGTMVELQLRSNATGRQYQIKVRRHEKEEEPAAVRTLSPASKDSWDSTSDED